MNEEHRFAETASAALAVSPSAGALTPAGPLDLGGRQAALPRWLSTVAVLAIAVLVASALVRWLHPHPGLWLAEPPVAAAFVAAYARVDEQALVPLVSPLYRAELARRGLADRRAFLPVPWDDDDSPPTSPWLEFTYVDGIVDRHGFTRLLYVVRSKLDGESRTPTTVWRVDLDPDGRVIWGEMVFGFGEATEFSVDRTTDVDLDALPTIAVPRALRPLWPHLQPHSLLTIASSEGHRYYTLGLTLKDTPASARGRSEIVIFFATDEEGRILQGAWTYATPVYRYGRQTAAEPVIPIPASRTEREEALLLQYLGTLW